MYYECLQTMSGWIAIIRDPTGQPLEYLDPVGTLEQCSADAQRYIDVSNEGE